MITLRNLFFAVALLAFAGDARALPRDLGTVLTASGTCTTSYVGGTEKATNHATRLSLFLTITKAGSGSSMSSAEFKLQVTYDSTNWVDAATTQSDTSMTTAIAHSITAPSAGATTRVLLQTESHAPATGWRVAAKVTGGACVAGDILLIKAMVL